MIHDRMDTFYIDATEDELNALVAYRMRYRRLTYAELVGGKMVEGAT